MWWKNSVAAIKWGV